MLNKYGWIRVNTGEYVLRLNKYVLLRTTYGGRIWIFIINASFFPYTFELVLRRLKKRVEALVGWNLFFLCLNLYSIIYYSSHNTIFIIAHCAFNLNKNFFDATLSAAVGCIPLRKCLKVPWILDAAGLLNIFLALKNALILCKNTI